MNKVIAIVLCMAVSTPAFAGHHVGRDVGRTVGLSFGFVSLGFIAGALFSEHNHRIPTIDNRCIVGYDHDGNKVYDAECFE